MHLENNTLRRVIAILLLCYVLRRYRYYRRLRLRRRMNLPNGYVAIGQGQLSYSPQLLIGQGANGTMVFKGMLGSQDVAVKKMLKAFYNTADREIELLMTTNHPNVLRYFQREDFGDFIHLALELCDMSLSDALQGRPDVFSILDAEPGQLPLIGNPGMQHAQFMQNSNDIFFFIHSSSWFF